MNVASLLPPSLPFTAQPVQMLVAGQESKQLDLRPEQLVLATIVDADDGKVRLELAGKQYDAALPGKFVAGQEVTLRVLQVEPHLSFAIWSPLDAMLRRYLPQVHQSSDFMALLRHILPEAGISSPGLQQIFQQLQQDPDGSLLQQLADRLGLLLESRLALRKEPTLPEGLKQLLMRMAEKEADPQVRERLEHAQQTLEGWQVLRARLGEQGFIFLPLPLTQPDEGYLLFDRPKKNQDTDASAIVHLHLKLQNLGGLHIRMHYAKSGLLVRCSCEDAAVCAYLNDARGELEDVLESFHLNGISFDLDTVRGTDLWQGQILSAGQNLLRTQA